MSFRARVAVTAAVAVAVAVLATSLGVYAATARTLTATTDDQLQRIATEVIEPFAARADVGSPETGAGERDRPRRFPGEGFRGGPRAGPFGGPGGFVQIVSASGQPTVTSGTGLPVSPAAVEAAASRGQRDRFLENAEIEGTSVRILNVPVEAGLVQVALPTDDTEAALARLRGQLTLGGLAGIGLAALLGLVVARRALRPVERLTVVAEEVAATQDLTRRIGTEGDDELGRLARTFDLMLANLEQARAAQEQLVADASHELRTPLTSLRTNIEVLEQADRLAPDQRRALIDDVVAQLAEFGRLVDGLVELARGDQPARAPDRVRLDDVVEQVVDRVATFARDRRFVVDASPTTVVAEADRLDRAVANLLDNAVKYGAGDIEVTVIDGTVRVRDHGPGIAADDLPHVFDRFYRSPEARSAPGSGLGLSIVEQVAASHGGTTEASNADDGGAVLTLRLPTAG